MERGIFLSFRSALIRGRVFLSISKSRQLINDVAVINWAKGPIFK